MRYTTAEASFPVFEVASEVTYQTPQRATVMERMLLLISSELAKDSPDRAVPLPELFERRLCVPHAAGLLAQSFEDMARNGMLSFTSDVREFRTVSLADFSVTADKGAAVIATGKLPGRPTTVGVQHLFDPITRQLRSAASKAGERLALAPNRSAADHEQFAALDTTPLVRVALDADPPDWRRSDTEIDAVQSELGGLRWRSTRMDVEIDAGGRLTVSLPEDRNTEKWLRQQPASSLWQDLVSPLFQTDDLDALPITEHHPQRRIVPHDAPSIAHQTDVIGNVCVQVQPSDAVQSEAPVGRVMVWVASDGTDPGIRWNQDGRGATVYLAGLDVDDHFVALVRNRVAGVTRLHTRNQVPVLLGELTYNVGVGVVDTGDGADGCWAAAAAELTDVVLASRRPEDLALLAAWSMPEEALARWLERMAPAGLHEVARQATALQQRMQALLGRPVAETLWQTTVSSACKRSLEHAPTEVDVPDMVALLQALRTLRLVGCAQFEDQLLARTRPVTTADDLRALRSALSPRPVPVTEQFCGPTVRHQLLEEAFASKPSLSVASPLEKAAADARRVLDALAAALHVDPATLDDEGAMQATLRYAQQNVRTLLQSWRKTAEWTQREAGADVVFGTRFAHLVETLRRYDAFLDGVELERERERRQRDEMHKQTGRKPGRKNRQGRRNS